MQPPRTSRASLAEGRSQANAVAQQALIAHWQNMVKSHLCSLFRDVSVAHSVTGSM